MFILNQNLQPKITLTNIFQSGGQGPLGATADFQGGEQDCLNYLFIYVSFI